MAQNDGKTLDERVREGLDAEKVAELLNNPNFDVQKSYTDDQIELLLNVDNVLSSREKNTEKTSSDSSLGSEGLFMMYDPSKNAYFLTLVTNGRAQFSETPSGEFNMDDAIPSIQPLIKILVAAGATEEKQLRTGYRKDSEEEKDEEKEKRKKGVPKKKPSYIIDKSVVDWCIKNGLQVIFNSLSRTESGGKQALDQEAIIQSLGFEAYRRLNEIGMQAYFQSWDGFIKQHKQEIGLVERIFLHKIASNPDLETLKSEFYKTKGIDLMNLIFIDPEGSIELDNLVHPSNAVNYRNARELYLYFDQRIKERNYSLSPHVALQVIRNTLRSNEFFTKLEKPLGERITRTTGVWLQYAIAGEVIEKDKYIKDQILPILHDESKTMPDKRFDVSVRLMSKYFLETTYSMTQYRFHIRGLWLLEYMKKADSETEELTAGSTESLYIDPANHLAQRFNVYEPLLMKAFDELLEHNMLDDKKMALEISAKCENVGKMLYEALRPWEKQKFTKLKNEEEHLSKGYREKALKLWVGVRREQLMEKYKTYVENKKEG